MTRSTPRIVAIVLGLMLLGLGATPAPAGDEPPAVAKLGEAAPEFTIVDTRGQKRTLSDYKGKIVVLEWIDPACPFVERLYRSGTMKAAYTEVRSIDKGVVWLAINSTSGTTAAKNDFWIRQHKITYPILLDTDGAVARVYDVRKTPQMFVIDAEGVLRYHGAIDDNPLSSKPAADVTNYVVNAVRQLDEDELVSPDHVKPYGCMLKR